MEQARLTPLRRIATPGGDVLHAMKATDPGYAGFGEAYFSMILPGAVKGWKQHTRMVLNLVVASGRIRFYLRDHALAAQSVELSPDDLHARLTVPPGFWVAFEGLGQGGNMLLNLASLGHDPTESINRPITAFPLEIGDKLA